MEEIKLSRKQIIQDYLTSKLSNPKLSYLILGTVSFLESILFPISPLMVLLPLCIVDRTRWLTYSLVVSVFSVTGSQVTFSIGYFCWDPLVLPLVEELGIASSVDRVSQMFSSGLNILVPVIGAFTPVTYNVVSAVCGFMAASENNSFIVMLAIFAVSSGIARSIRFIAETWLIVKIIEGNSWIVKNYPNITTYIRRKLKKEKKIESIK